MKTINHCVAKAKGVVSKQHKHVLQTHLPKLVEHLQNADISPILMDLHASRVITNWTKQDIIKTDLTPNQQKEKLFDTIRSEKAFYVMVKSLVKNCHLELAEMLVQGENISLDSEVGLSSDNESSDNDTDKLVKKKGNGKKNVQQAKKISHNETHRQTLKSRKRKHESGERDEDTSDTSDEQDDSSEDEPRIKKVTKQKTEARTANRGSISNIGIEAYIDPVASNADVQSQWEALGKKLKLNPSTIVNIKHARRFDNLSLCVYDILGAWDMEKPDEANLANLVKCLDSMGFKKLSEELVKSAS